MLLGKNWAYSEYSDGTEQIRYTPRGPLGNVYIERVVKHRSRRPKWHIVDRRPGEKYEAYMYPPSLAGPFDTGEQAMVVFEVMVRTGGFDTDPD